MPDWKEFEIKNFLGIAQSSVTPTIEHAEDIRNLDPRNTRGALRTRMGYKRKYPKPVDEKLSNVTYLSSENFFISNIDNDYSKEREVTVYINKGTVKGEEIVKSFLVNANFLNFSTPHGLVENDFVYVNIDNLFTGFYYVGYNDIKDIYLKNSFATNNFVPIDVPEGTAGSLALNPIPKEIKMLNVWVRPYYEVDKWIDKWMWLNEVFATKVYGYGKESQNYTIYINLQTTPDAFNGWTVINTTRNEFAIILKTKLDPICNKTIIKISKNDSRWGVGDDIYIVRQYIPFNEMLAMSSVVPEDVVFHKILNDIKVAFGGFKDRIALSVGYRKRKLCIDRNSSASFFKNDLECKEEVFDIDTLLVTPIVETQLNKFISEQAPPNLDDNIKVKYVGVLDGYMYQLMGEGELYASTPYVNFRLTDAVVNKRLTGIDVYFSDDGGKNFFYYKNFPIYTDDVNRKPINSLTNEGEIALKSSEDLYDYEDALIWDSVDFNSSGSWQVVASTQPVPVLATMNVVANSTLVPSLGNSTGSYHIVCETTSNLPNGFFGMQKMINDKLRYNTKYFIKIKIHRINSSISIPTQPIVSFLSSGGGSGQPDVNSKKIGYSLSDAWTNEWALFTFNLTTPKHPTNSDSNDIIPSQILRIYANALESGFGFRVESLSIRAVDNEDYITDGTPRDIFMQDRLGYTPTFDVVRSWDYALVTKGRTFVCNPYIDMRYENKIFSSNIAGTGAFMWDVITADNYFELENFDGNDVMGLEVLPNMDILTFRKNSIETRDSNVGIIRNMVFGNGLIAKKSPMNFGDKVIWCGKDDVYLTNGYQVEAISDGLIRNEYRAIPENRRKVIASLRENNENSYRMTANGKEFIFTKVGWITDVRPNDNPDHYLSSVKNTIIFASNGDIFEQSARSNDNGRDIKYHWRSIPLDINLLGEGITGNQRLYIRSLWINYEAAQKNTRAANLSISIFLDNSIRPFTVIPFSLDHWKNYQTAKIRLGSMCRRFQIEINGVDELGGQLEILSVGIMYKVLLLGKHDGR